MDSSFLSILPPLLAIALALKFKQVVPALLAGIFCSLIIIEGLSIKTLSSFLDKYLVETISDSDHVYVILFTLFIGATVSLIQFNGGMNGVINHLHRYIHNQKQALLATYGLGLLIFFDDYANTLIVGSSMRNITDKYGVSREKLAYIVDSTSAPLAAVAFVSTWIGAELGYIDDAIKGMQIEQGAYELFLSSLGSSFYPILSLFFVGLIITKNKDYGDMKTIQTIIDNDSNVNNRIGKTYAALIPIVTLICITLFGIVYTGFKNSGGETAIRTLIANSNAYSALLWGSSLSLFVAVIITLKEGNNFSQILSNINDGFKSMLDAIIILVLAWILSSTLKELNTAQFIGSLIDSYFQAQWLPALIFVIAGLTSFATGSSWGTMALLYPIAIPVVYQSIATNVDNQFHLLPVAISAVLGGGVFGDHCSPISDTTILSSASTQCNHINHVKTQIPYALTVGTVSFLLYLGAGILNINWPLFLLGAVSLWFIHKYLAKE